MSKKEGTGPQNRPVPKGDFQMLANMKERVYQGE